MKRKTTRVCALCDKIIADVHVVCAQHYQDYLLYKNEPWFKELVMAQRKMFEIDNVESLLGVGYIPKPYQKLTESEKQAIKFLRSKGLGPRNISKLININSKTIENYLYPRSVKKDKQH